MNSLLIIDPQNDFADPDGALSVPGAADDMQRLGLFIAKNGEKLSQIHVTLDSHHLMHIANPAYWRDCNGQHPKPFTVITAKDVGDKVWSGHDDWALEYLQKLEAGGRYPHVIWPPHCLIGSWGHGIFPFLFRMITDWEYQFSAGSPSVKVADMITKGSSNKTEHFSAIRAEVEIDSEPHTKINLSLLDSLAASDRIFVGGIAGSHCVKSTVLDILEFNPSLASKLFLLRDCISPVPGFEKEQDLFFDELKKRGACLTESTIRLF